MKQLRLPLFAVAAALSLFAFSASATAPEEFLKKVQLSLSASAQTALGQETLSGFPVLVRISTAISGFSYADIAANHSDIAFGTDDGATITPYPYEIDTWDPNGTSLVWVRVPSLSAASAFNFYYGNGVSVANTPSDVWTGYAGVWHLNEDSGTASDSTANGLNATPSGANSSECVAVSTAPTGTGRQLASVKAHKSYLSIPNYDSLGLGGTFTISAWAKADLCDVKYSARYFSRKDGYQDKNGWEAEQRYDASSATVPATTISARGANSGDYTASLPNITQNWVYVVLAYDGTTLQYYVNGNKAETRTLNSAATDNGKTLSFGNNPKGSESNWVGAMDEIRLRGFVPTEAWEAAEYATVANPAFLVYGDATEIDTAAPVFGAGSTSVSGNDVVFSVTLESLSGPTSVSVFYSADGGTTFTELSLGSANATGTLTGTASDLDVGDYLWYAQAVSSVNGTDHSTRTPNHAFTVVHAKDPVAAYKSFEVTISYAGTAASNVPLLLRISEADIDGFRYADITESGFEILDENGNLLPYEIDTWDTDGESLLWTRVPSYSDGATLTIRYGTAFANQPIPASGVWADYAGVWHLNDTNSASAYGSYPNSTAAAGIDGVKAEASIADEVGVFGKSVKICDAGAQSGDYKKGGVFVPDSGAGSPLDLHGSFAISGWFKHKNQNFYYDHVFYKRQKSDNSGSPTGSFAIEMSGGKIADAKMDVRGTQSSGPGAISMPSSMKDAWAYLTFVYNGATVSTYQNGTLVKSQSISPATDNDAPLAFGNNATALPDCLTADNDCAWCGWIDEVRLVRGAPTADWVAAEYAAMTDASAVSFSLVSTIDSATPVLSVPTVERNADGSFTVSVVISGNEPAAGTVQCTIGGMDYAMATADASLPMTYAVTVSGLAAGTYTAMVRADSTTGNTSYSACPTAFHVGALDVTVLSNADEGSLTPGVFRVSRADVDPTGLPALRFDVAFSGDALAAAVEPPDVSVLTIPAGESHLDVTITPVYTTDVAVDTAVVLTASGTNIGQPSSATMTVVNADYDVSVRYVATTGDDANHGGTPELPKKTIGAAVASLNNVAETRTGVVHVAPGLYPISSPISVSHAIRILGDDPDPSRTVVSNTFTVNWDNQNKRVFYLNHADALVANLTMQKGQYYYGSSGGNFYIGSAGGMVSNCVVEAGATSGNAAAGGAWLDGGVVTHSVFRRNKCDSGSASWSRNRPGVLSLNSGARAENCLFADNPQTKNVVLISLNGSSVMRNCSIVDSGLSVTNDDCSAWSALQISSSATVQNVVIAGVTNTVDGAACPPTGTVEKFVNGAFDGDASGLPEGTVVGTAAKFFRDFAHRDYRPIPGGPLANAGVNYSPMASVDLAGDPRLVGSRIDIGCYEAPSAGTVLILR